MKPIGPYVAARELPGTPGSAVRTLRATERLTGMPVLLHVLPHALNLPELPEHPHLLPIIDSGMDDDQVFVVTELPLGSAPASDALLMARGVLSALSTLHEHGVIHGGITATQLWSTDGHVALAGAGLPWRDQPSEQDDLHDLAVALQQIGPFPPALRPLLNPAQANRLSAREALALLDQPLDAEPAPSPTPETAAPEHSSAVTEPLPAEPVEAAVAPQEASLAAHDTALSVEPADEPEPLAEAMEGEVTEPLPALPSDPTDPVDTEAPAEVSLADEPRSAAEAEAQSAETPTATAPPPPEPAQPEPFMTRKSKRGMKKKKAALAALTAHAPEQAPEALTEAETIVETASETPEVPVEPQEVIRPSTPEAELPLEEPSPVIEQSHEAEFAPTREPQAAPDTPEQEDVLAEATATEPALEVPTDEPLPPAAFAIRPTEPAPEVAPEQLETPVAEASAPTSEAITPEPQEVTPAITPSTTPPTEPVAEQPAEETPRVLGRVPTPPVSGAPADLAESPQERRRRQNEERRAQAMLDAKASAERKVKRLREEAEARKAEQGDTTIRIGLGGGLDDLPAWTPPGDEAMSTGSRRLHLRDVERLPPSLRRPVDERLSEPEPEPEISFRGAGRLPSRQVDGEPIRIGWEEDDSWRVVKTAPAPEPEPFRLPRWVLPLLAALLLIGGVIWGLRSASHSSQRYAVQFSAPGLTSGKVQLTVLQAPAEAHLARNSVLGSAPGEVYFPATGTYFLKAKANGIPAQVITVLIPKHKSYVLRVQ